MPKAVREKIFEPFFTTKPAGKGTGMGMPISYQIIVERHQGTLDCISTPGVGTEFIIQIPRKLNRTDSGFDNLASNNLAPDSRSVDSRAVRYGV